MIFLCVSQCSPCLRVFIFYHMGIESTEMEEEYFSVFLRALRASVFYNSGEVSYSTFTRTPSECALNSGAYIHWMVVMPLEKSPVWEARSVYSKT